MGLEFRSSAPGPDGGSDSWPLPRRMVCKGRGIPLSSEGQAVTGWIQLTLQGNTETRIHALLEAPPGHRPASQHTLQTLGGLRVAPLLPPDPTPVIAFFSLQPPWPSDALGRLGPAVTHLC